MLQVVQGDRPLPPCITHALYCHGMVGVRSPSCIAHASCFPCIEHTPYVNSMALVGILPGKIVLHLFAHPIHHLQ
jgi:hypothetical protein